MGTGVNNVAIGHTYAMHISVLTWKRINGAQEVEHMDNGEKSVDRHTPVILLNG